MNVRKQRLSKEETAAKNYAESKGFIGDTRLGLWELRALGGVLSSTDGYEPPNKHFRGLFHRSQLWFCIKKLIKKGLVKRREDGKFEVCL